MKIKIEDIGKAHDILQNYKGTNPFIIKMKNNVFAFKNTTLNDFQIEYILKNHAKEPICVSKTINVATWYGEKKQLDWNTDFIIKKLFVSFYFGETITHYHLMVKYRQSGNFEELFVPKDAILNPLFLEDFNDINVDFNKYNEKSGLTLKPHQERSIKFLLARKKCVLSLQMGMGKSLCSIVSALEGKFEKILIICPASLKTNWQKELNYFIENDEITIVNGSKWKENRFTIINYDILKNFYTVPKETKKIKQKEYTDDGQIKWSTVEKIVKTNKTDIVAEALDNSQLFQSQFDLIIIDEAHRLSNKSSGMYEIVEDLVKRSQPKGIYELTGTMIKNNPINLFNVLKLINADITNNWVEYVKKYCDGKQIYKNKKERNYFTNKFLSAHNKQEWKDLTYNEKQELDIYLTQNCKKIWLTNGASNLDELSERIKHLYYCETSAETLKDIKKVVKVINYDLTSEEKIQYDNAWNEYLNTHEEKDLDKLIQNHQLIEGSVFRQLLADFMVSRSINLAERAIKNGHKVIIFCCFDKELYSLEEYFKDRCVIYNGKMTAKKKDEALNKFKTDETVNVFIGNLQSANVGLNINEASVIIFNNISFVPSDNEQAEYRILRLGQTKDCYILYQSFNNTYMERLYEILKIKNEIINALVFEENKK